MTPESLPELDTTAFRRAVAAALGLPVEDAMPRLAARRAAPAPPPAAAWDPLGTVELSTEDVHRHDAPAPAPAHQHDAPAQRRAA